MIRSLGTALAFACVLGASSTYDAAIEAWRAERERKLKAPEGWLAVAGLFWLKEGENRAGSDPSYEIVLPEERSPKRMGVFDFHNGKVSFRVASGARVLVNGKGILTAELKSDKDGATPDTLQMGDLSMTVIYRGDKYALRLRDTQSKMRKEFTKLTWYPVKEAYRVEAKFTEAPKKIPIPNILGMVEQEPSPGYVTFRLNGQQLRLEPVLEDGTLFFIFRDLTAGKTTYGSGRFLYADLPKDGKVVLDFNKAYTPPCAFTPFATCPLPPKQNRMAIRIEAGELNYGHH